MSRIFTIIALTIVFSMSMVTGVFAKEDVKQKDNVNVKITSSKEKEFDVTVSPVKKVEKVMLLGKRMIASVGFEDNFEIVDLRGTQSGWDFSVSALPLKSEEKELPKGTLSLKPPQEIVSEKEQVELPKVMMRNNSVIDDGEVLVAQAREGTGMGKYDVVFDEEALMLNVDSSEIESGVYETTLEWGFTSQDEEKYIVKREDIAVEIDVEKTSVEDTGNKEEVNKDELESNESEDAKDKIDYVGSNSKEEIVQGNGKDEINEGKLSQVQESIENDESTHIEGKQDNEHHSQGELLPNTATNTFSILLVGAILMLVGGFVYLYRRRVE